MNLLRVTKDEIDCAEYHHGGERISEQSRAILDFSVNTNPLGLPESVKSAIQNAIPDLERYPDQHCTKLREKIAAKYNTISASHIICGNGASELISLIVAAIQPKTALVLAPTFSGYEKSLRAARAKICYHTLTEESNFTLDETIFGTIQKAKPDLIFLCSPNNPTGRVIEKNLLERIAAHCDEAGIFLVVDECFLDFTARVDETMFRFVEKNPHLVVLNAFTKIYAMAGIRLGYLAASNVALLQKINALRPEWNVSTLAQIAGETALDKRYYIEETCTLIKKEREYLSKELKALGFQVFPSEANFILFKVPDNKEIDSELNKKAQKNLNMSEKLDDFLLQNEISIRNCGNFRGLSENFYRTAVRTHEENVCLLNGIKSFLLQIAE